MTNQIVLLACYELGRQPLSLAWPLASLAEADLAASGYDLSIDALPEEAIRQAKFVGIAAPMHTALRLGIRAAERVRAINPNVHICFYGLYAGLNSEYLLDRIADSIISGEVEESLANLATAIVANENADSIAGISTKNSSALPHLARLSLPIPQRQSLPPLDQYAHYTHQGRHALSGYVEASRGCLHTCAHCPITPVYKGRFFVVAQDTVLADIRQQVEAGARHITFGDPDFLNGPKHAQQIAAQLHEEFPDVTFDFTTKVEHILKHQELIKEFGAYGCSFVVSAFEITNNAILDRLNKGHSRADMEKAIAILRNASIAPQPTWMPFTPWTKLEDYLDLLQWIRMQDLIPHVPAVQLSIRMLVPPGSALLDHADVDTWAGPLDHSKLTHTWQHPDPRMDALQQEISQLAEHADPDKPFEAFRQIEEAAYSAAGLLSPQPEAIPPYQPQPPKLTEHWYC